MRIDPIGEGSYQFYSNPTARLFNIVAGRPDEDKPLNPLKVNLERTLQHQYPEEEKIASYGFNQLFLQYPNEELRKLAYSIVGFGDSNDEKVEKITKWVITHIKYAEDVYNYGRDELWVPPIFTLRKGSGDCEDGAFLIHSLLLNADVPSERLRTYGGQVKAGVGARSSGHAWTAYRRESDNEWVVIDFSYYPELLPTDTREIMKEDTKYIDDYFFMTLYEFVKTEGINRVRDPEGYDQLGRMNQKIWIGGFIDTFI